MSRPLPRFTDPAIERDPVQKLIAQREAEVARAREEISRGVTPLADPADLRGIPCLAKGVGGTSPGTNPQAAANRSDHRLHDSG